MRLPDLGMATETPGLSLARGGRIVAWTSSEPEVGIWEEETGPRTPSDPAGFRLLRPRRAEQGRQPGRCRRERRHPYLGSRRVKRPRAGALERKARGQRWHAGTGYLVQIRCLRSGTTVASTDSLSTRLSCSPSPSPATPATLDEVDFAPEVGLAVEVTEESRVTIDLATGRRSPGPKLGLPTVSAVALSRDGHLLVAADGEESAVLWDMRRGRHCGGWLLAGSSISRSARTRG